MVIGEGRRGGKGAGKGGGGGAGAGGYRPERIISLLPVFWAVLCRAWGKGKKGERGEGQFSRGVAVLWGLVCLCPPVLLDVRDFGIYLRQSKSLLGSSNVVQRRVFLGEAGWRGRWKDLCWDCRCPDSHKQVVMFGGGARVSC